MITNKTLNKVFFINELQFDLYSKHSLNVSELSYQLSLQVVEDYPELGLGKDFAEIIRVASLIHDVGKMCIPFKILSKPNTLSYDEYKIIQTHTTKGNELINTLFKYSSLNDEDKVFVEMCKDICLHHQERLDGSGYPEGLTKDNISIAAQIVGITDSYDAMTSDRVYKDKISSEYALQVLKEESNKYNEDFIKSFQKIIQKYN